MSVAIHYDRVQHELQTIEMQIWRLHQRLGAVALASVFMPRAIPCQPVEAALLMAHERIGQLRQALRDAEKEDK
jgi:hypothetical protein